MLSLSECNISGDASQSFRITEAFVKANDHIKIQGTGERWVWFVMFWDWDHQLAHARLLKMSEAIDDMTAYTKLTDHFVIQQIRTSQGTQLGEASCDWTVGVPCCHCVVYLCVPVCVCV